MPYRERTNSSYFIWLFSFCDFNLHLFMPVLLDTLIHAYSVSFNLQDSFTVYKYSFLFIINGVLVYLFTCNADDTWIF